MFILGSSNLLYFSNLWRAGITQVSIETRLRGWQPRFDSRQWERYFLFATAMSKPTLLSNGYLGLFPGSKAAVVLSWPLNST